MAGGARGRPSTPDGADLHRDIAAREGRQRQVRRCLDPGGGGVWMTPAYDKESNTDLRRGRQSVARPRWRHPPGRQPLHRLRRRDRREHRQDQVVLPDGAARRVGPRRRLPAGGDDDRRQEGRRARRQDRLGVRARCRRPASWSAAPTTSCRRRTCSRCPPAKGTRMLPGANGGVGVVAHRGGSDARATRSWPRCTSR